MKKIAILLTALFLSSSVLAETVYVTDSFRAPIRSGKTNGYRVIAELKSGISVTLIEHDKASGYSKIKTRSGIEGWILTRYLLNEPISRHKLIALQKSLKTWQKDKNTLKLHNKDLQKSSTSLQADNQTLTNLNNKLKEELGYVKKISGNAININQRNQQLTEENQQLQNQTDLLSSENTRLKENSKHDFFLLGAGTVILGLFLGLIIPSFRPKRKDTGWV